MKILVLNGSPRKGNTLTAINSFVKGVSCEHDRVAMIIPLI